MIAQGLKDQMWATEGWSRLAPDQRQALEVIQDKVARILNGDPDYTDNWHDIAGYARLVEDRLTCEEELSRSITSPPLCDPSHVIPPTSAAGWIEWKGGECPVPQGVRVDVKHQDGEVYYHQLAGDFGRAYAWDHIGVAGDIIAYRLSPKQD